MSHEPAPGTPYASRWSEPPKPVVYAPEDQAMLGIAVVGAGLALFTLLPVGVITGPLALRRARRVEDCIAQGTRPASDRTAIAATRAAAWVSIVISAPVLLLAVVIAFVLVAGAIF